VSTHCGVPQPRLWLKGSGSTNVRTNAHFEGLTMSAYQNDIKAVSALKETAGNGWNAINPESVARIRAQNRFKTGLDIATYTAAIMRKDMAEYDADTSAYTQSPGCRSEERRVGKARRP